MHFALAVLTDHVLILMSLISRHATRSGRGKIHGRFIDYKKEFDTLSHEGLFLKLSDNNAKCNFFYNNQISFEEIK